MVQCKPKKSAEIDSQRYRCEDQSSLPAPHLALRAGFFQELGAGFLEAVALLGGEAGDAVLGDFVEEGVDGFDDVVARGGGLGERDGARLGEGAEMLAGAALAEEIAEGETDVAAEVFDEEERGETGGPEEAKIDDGVGGEELEGDDAKEDGGDPFGLEGEEDFDVRIDGAEGDEDGEIYGLGTAKGEEADGKRGDGGEDAGAENYE